LYSSRSSRAVSTFGVSARTGILGRNRETMVALIPVVAYDIMKGELATSASSHIG
jgi:hypothetical protein